MVDRDRAKLHPLMRAAAEALDAAIAAAHLPFQLYEGYRDPTRQAMLYSHGRVPGMGPAGHYATRARAWESFHNYGLACDYAVLGSDGRWVWPPANDPRWDEFQALAQSCGLHHLSFERPHVEIPCSLHALAAGSWPPGDDSWAANMCGIIAAWGDAARQMGGLFNPGAPPWNGPFACDLSRPPMGEP